MWGRMGNLLPGPAARREQGLLWVPSCHVFEDVSDPGVRCIQLSWRKGSFCSVLRFSPQFAPNPCFAPTPGRQGPHSFKTNTAVHLALLINEGGWGAQTLVYLGPKNFLSLLTEEQACYVEPTNLILQ